MGKQQNQKPDGPPPAYPDQVHLDAGPAPQGSNGGAAGNGPYNTYGGFNNTSHKPDQSHLDPRAAENPYTSPAPGHFASPAPGGYASPAPGGYGAPPQGYYGGYPQQQQMYYGPPQGHYPGPGYGPPQGPYYGGADRGYYDRRGMQDEGICAGLFAAMACCCCFDLLMF